jgi:hypothetical protein
MKSEDRKSTRRHTQTRWLWMVMIGLGLEPFWVFGQPTNPVETRRYGIEVGGIRVGTMTATRQFTGPETATYTLVSDVQVNFLVYKLRIYYKVVNLFRQGQLQLSTVDARTNRGTFSSRTEWKSDHYDIVAEQYKHSYRATERRPITQTVTNLYFAEPNGQPTAFAEYFGDYFTLTPRPAMGIYRTQRDGSEDEYQYQDGQLVRIVKKNALKNFVIKRLP